MKLIIHLLGVLLILFGPARVWPPTEIDRVLAARTDNEVLGLSARPGRQSVRTAHRAVGRLVHPDKLCAQHPCVSTPCSKLLMMQRTGKVRETRTAAARAALCIRASVRRRQPLKMRRRRQLLLSRWRGRRAESLRNRRAAECAWTCWLARLARRKWREGGASRRAARRSFTIRV